MSQTSISTSLTIAFAGMLADSGPNDIITRHNSEASAEMPFGVGVKQGVADAAALLPAAQADDIIGVVLHSHAYAKPTELGDDGLKPEAVMSLLRRGRVYVQVEEAVAPGDRGFCRRTAGAGEQLGAWRASADSTDCVDCTKQTVFLTTASASGFAVMECDFLNEPDA